MASFRKKGRVWYFRFTDADGNKKERKGCPDRRATEDMAREAETEAARIRAGSLDPRELAYRRHAGRTLADHLADFQSALMAKGGTPKHANLFSDRARRVAALVRGAGLADIDPPKTAKQSDRNKATVALARVLTAARLADLTPVRVQDALATLRDAGRSLQTCNHHRAAIRAFSRWAWKDGRLRDDPLIGVSGFNANEDRRHDRRTISLDELRQLIKAAHNGPTYQKMTGSMRALCYRLAAGTGLRYSEIASITPKSFDLTAKHPTVTVEAAYTKNGDPATLPLPFDLAADLRPVLAALAHETPVFPLPAKGASMLRVDLTSAEIPYRDGDNRVFDFHALRCQCATMADAAGATPRVVQKVMRHSTLELTGRYTRPRMHDIEGAVSSMPSLRPSEPEPMAATGTDGQQIGKRFSHYLPTGETGLGRNESDTGVLTPTENPPLMSRKPLSLTGFDGSGRVDSVSDVSSGDRIRTCDLRFMSPLL